jgi:hypothetical protein
MVHHGLLRGREFDEEAKYIQQIEQFLDHQIVPPAKRDGIQLGWISTDRLTGAIQEPMADDPHVGHLVVPDSKGNGLYLSMVALALRYAARQVPRDVLIAAWPGEPWLLERLLGGPAPATG